MVILQVALSQWTQLLYPASPPVASRPRNNARPETKVTIYKIQGYSKVRFKVTERSDSRSQQGQIQGHNKVRFKVNERSGSTYC